MIHDSIYQDWVKRNFSNDEVAFFAEMAASQNQKANEKLWINFFTKAKSLMNLEPSAPEVQQLAKQWMNSANEQYQSNQQLRNKMWELMKSGDIPAGFLPGYEKDIVLFMNRAIGILFEKR